LIRDAKGNLYGTTTFGGNLSCNSPNGCGVVFKWNPKGGYSVLHAFTGGADGAYPIEGVVRDPSGNLYGTSIQGGAFGYGTVFKLKISGEVTPLYSFNYGVDGFYPYTALIRDLKGNLYGTTREGGDIPCPNDGGGCGVVFKLDSTGVYSVLHTFTGGTDGGWPFGSLLRDVSGNLYGTAYSGGDVHYCQWGCGLVFKIAP
jgi:uncharacterized repeat protein (TIGR03803 family)